MTDLNMFVPSYQTDAALTVQFWYMFLVIFQYNIMSECLLNWLQLKSPLTQLSIRMGIKGLLIRDSPESLSCVIE